MYLLFLGILFAVIYGFITAVLFYISSLGKRSLITKVSMVPGQSPGTTIISYCFCGKLFQIFSSPQDGLLLFSAHLILLDPVDDGN